MDYTLLGRDGHGRVPGRRKAAGRGAGAVGETSTMAGIMAQLAVTDGEAGRLLLCTGVLILAVLGLGVLLVLVRRLYQKLLQWHAAAAFPLADLEQMHRQGLITDEEFGRLRKRSLRLDDRAPENTESQSRPPAKDDDEGVGAGEGCA